MYKHYDIDDKYISLHDCHLQKEGVIKKHFGKPVPIIVNGLEYAWYDIEATKKANPAGEADTFLKAAKKLGIY